MAANKNPEDKEPSLAGNKAGKANTEAERGKKAIEAGTISAGENPNATAVKQKEEKDASKWRNEG